MTYIVLGSKEEGLNKEVSCYSEGCYLEVLPYSTFPFISFKKISSKSRAVADLQKFALISLSVSSFLPF